MDHSRIFIQKNEQALPLRLCVRNFQKPVHLNQEGLTPEQQHRNEVEIAEGKRRIF